MYTAHVEARIEAAHRNGPPGHKCAGTHPGLPAGLEDKVRDAVLRAGTDAAPIVNEVVEALKGEFDFHGHSWKVEIEWLYGDDSLDEYGWGPVDFGAAKGLIRRYDHHNLNVVLPERIVPSAERLAQHLYEEFNVAFGRYPLLVRVHEGGGNIMTYQGDGGLGQLP